MGGTSGRRGGGLWRPMAGKVLVSGTIFDIKKYSIHDGPGIRTTVFFKGCPLHCRWCHNPESQQAGKEMIYRQNRCLGCRACLAACEQGAIAWVDDRPVVDRERCTLCGACVEACYPEAREIVGREVSVAALMAEIERDVSFYDESGGGVTISGGEPLAQPAFLRALLVACKGAELHTALDTCGYAPWSVLEDVRGYVDLFLYDLKLMDEARHRDLTGVSNGPILDNLLALSERGHDIIIRVPVIPGVNDGQEELRQIGAFAARLPHLRRLDLLPYHHIAVEKYERLERAYAFSEARPPSEAQLVEIAALLRTFDLEGKIGG